MANSDFAVCCMSGASSQHGLLSTRERVRPCLLNGFASSPDQVPDGRLGV